MKMTVKLEEVDGSVVLFLSEAMLAHMGVGLDDTVMVRETQDGVELVAANRAEPPT